MHIYAYKCTHIGMHTWIEFCLQFVWSFIPTFTMPELISVIRCSSLNKQNFVVCSWIYFLWPIFIFFSAFGIK